MRSVKHVKASAIRPGGPSYLSRTTGTRDTTVYIDTTGTTYTQLQRGHHLNFSNLPPETTRLRIWVSHRSLFRFAYREARGNMTETAPCPLVGEILEPCFNWNVILSRHSRIEASFHAHPTK